MQLHCLQVLLLNKQNKSLLNSLTLCAFYIQEGKEFRCDKNDQNITKLHRKCHTHYKHWFMNVICIWLFNRIRFCEDYLSQYGFPKHGGNIIWEVAWYIVVPKVWCLAYS
jgi:hypothetical protein